ncbi:MAG: hypothetical protein HQM16_09820 [Deltaproteobacteria bacterium]|nr:hypothetical protein [Deltaproteobacteria bacterium]
MEIPSNIINNGMVRGKRVIKKRSFPLGRKNFFRLTNGDTLDVHVVFCEGVCPQQVLLVVEPIHLKDTIPFQVLLKQNMGRYEGVAQFTQSGVYRFKTCYELAGAWYWDNKPYAYVIVDPKGVRDIRQYIFLPVASGHFGDWSNDLKRIHDLGFNTIHLLPLTEMGQSESPYAADDLLKIDAVYLDPQVRADGVSQLKAFVSEVKRLGMRLCIDLVLNNVGISNRLCSLKPEWFCEDLKEKDGIKRGGWSDEKKWHKWLDLACLDYNSPNTRVRRELWQYMTDYALFWTGFAAETGGIIRLDNLHSGNEAFMRHVLSEIRGLFPEIIIQAELFEKEERIEKLVLDYGINLLLATPWEHKFVPELRTYIKYLHKKHKRLKYFIPVCSHDSKSPKEEFGDTRSTIPRLAVSSLMGSGPSGIVQGIEFGLDKKIPFIGKRPRENFEIHAEFYQLIQEVNRLIKADQVFQIAGNLRFIDGDHHAVLGAARTTKGSPDPVVFIFANLDIFNKQRINVKPEDHAFSLKGRTLKHVMGTGEFEFKEGVLSVLLEPCGIRVLRVV